MQRLTDFFAQLANSFYTAFVRWARTNYGLPITLTNAIACPVAATTNLSVTVPVDCYVRNVVPVIVNPAALAAPDLNGFVSSVTIAGFTLYQHQGVVTPLFSSTNPNTAESSLDFTGYPRGIELRQGDVITIAFTNNNAAVVLQGSVMIDAFRKDDLRPAS